MTLTRTQISLSDDDRRVLDAAARRTGRSMSALIRDAIHTTYGQLEGPERIRTLIDMSFGVVGIEFPGEELVDALRSGRRLSESA
ncbi:CopG family transcriptional regulator [Microbacterium sp. 22242]|uniref:ribbon-helix-helix domain-containing protein n=1 Tax=Microbacterium sp. 22242 TaxID=3453896 RepID=UPI003F8511DD